MLKVTTIFNTSLRYIASQSKISNAILLHDGYTIPLFGLGCYKLKKELTESAVLSALTSGYRLLDTAEAYGNEACVGSAIKKSGIPRKDLYVVTKLSTKNGSREAQKKCLESLQLLGLDYIDLYLIHSPSNGFVLETWEAFLKLQQDGYVKSVGVSNFNIHHLEPMKQHGFPSPVVNQIEHHPWYQQTELVNYCRENNITVMGYCPLARSVSFDFVPLIKEIAKKYSKSERQVLLRWSIQKNVITIPKSSIHERIVQNIDIYDFDLTEQEMHEITNLNENRRIAGVTALCEPWLG